MATTIPKASKPIARRLPLRQRSAVITVGGQPTEPDEEDDVIKPLPERLVAELTAHRTLALHDALANNPHVAMTALLHRLVMERYQYSAPRAVPRSWRAPSLLLVAGDRPQG